MEWKFVCALYSLSLKEVKGKNGLNSMRQKTQLYISLKTYCKPDFLRNPQAEHYVFQFPPPCIFPSVFTHFKPIKQSKNQILLEQIPRCPREDLNVQFMANDGSPNSGENKNNGKAVFFIFLCLN